MSLPTKPINLPLKPIDYDHKNSPNNILPLLKSPFIMPIGKLSVRLMGKVTQQTFEAMVELLNKDLSLNSKKAIAADFSDFCKWFHNTNEESLSPDRLTERDIVDFRNACQKKNQKVNTINRKIISLRSFCKMAIEKGFTHKNVAEKVKLLRQQQLAPKRLSQSEFRRFLREVEHSDNLRNQLIIELMVGAGLRVSEVANLKVSDVTFSDRKGAAEIHHSKGNKDRMVPLNARIREFLKAYLEKYQPKDFLFIGQRGPIKSLAINHIVQVYAKKANVKCWPHLLRHHFSYNFLSHHQGEIVGLAQILGHSSLNTTNLYTQHRLEDLQARVENLFY